MAIESLGKLLIMIGVVSICIGASFIVLGRVPWIGKLPGDIVIKGESFTFYFPVATMILLSLILTLLFNLIGKK